jgi:glycerol kinase
MKYVIGVDQSTQGTKALLFDERGALAARTDVAHPQLVSREGWVSHAPIDLYRNTVAAVCQLVGLSGISRGDVAAVGISNQRETSVLWDRDSGLPLNDAVVWHCARAKDICQRPETHREAERIRSSTGLPLSPYFPAAKWAWLLENTPGAKEAARAGRVCLGTVDSWLLFKLTGAFRTDVSNAARTQLFNIRTLAWDESLCALFGIPPKALPEVCPSDALFGQTDFEGFLPRPVPVHAVMGDSNCALFGQGCREAGQVKATYGTGSSVMMNISPAARDQACRCGGS